MNLRTPVAGCCCHGDFVRWWPWQQHPGGNKVEPRLMKGRAPILSPHLSCRWAAAADGPNAAAWWTTRRTAGEERLKMEQNIFCLRKRWRSGLDPDQRCLQVAWECHHFRAGLRWRPADCTFTASPEGGGGAKVWGLQAVRFWRNVLEQFTQKIFDLVKADQQRPRDSLAVSMATLHVG